MINHKEMLLLDIETVASHPDFESYQAENTQYSSKVWDSRIQHLEMDQQYSSEEGFSRFGSLYPEWGKIINITIGQLVKTEDGEWQTKVKSFYGEEKEILENFFNMLIRIFEIKPKIKIFGHYIKNFDLPFIIKRALKWRVPVPQQLHLHNQKPWEQQVEDLYDFWKMGAWGSTKSAPLGVICDFLGVPSPKEVMEGGEVSKRYWENTEEELPKIIEYCELDVKALADIILALNGETENWSTLVN